jgi:hypothetical protein
LNDIGAILAGALRGFVWVRLAAECGGEPCIA